MADGEKGGREWWWVGSLSCEAPARMEQPRGARAAGLVAVVSTALAEGISFSIRQLQREKMASHTGSPLESNARLMSRQRIGPRGGRDGLA